MNGLYQNCSGESKLHFGNYYHGSGQQITLYNGHIFIIGLQSDGSSYFDPTTGEPIYSDGKFIVTVSKIAGYSEPDGQVQELVKRDIKFFQSYLRRLALKKDISIVLNVDKSMLDGYSGKSSFCTWLVFDRRFAIRSMEGNDMKFSNDRLARAEFDLLKINRDKLDKNHKRFITLTKKMTYQVKNAFMFQIEYSFQKNSPEPDSPEPDSPEPDSPEPDSPEPVLKRRRTSRVITDS
jgi:hypothetical protein